MYCGDETGSFIGDVGSHTSRFGYGGEDNPKYVAPSYMAEAEEEERKSHIPSSCYQGRLASQTVKPMLRMPWFEESKELVPQIDPNAYLQQGDIVHDWDALERIWQTSMDLLRVSDTKKHTTGGEPYPKKVKSATANATSSSTVVQANNDSTNWGGGGARCVHPILAVTPGLTHSMNGTGPKHQAAVQREQQIRLTEFLMETLEAPAVYLAPTPMLSSFCFGRQTALIVDVGAGGCRVTPVVDGLILKQAQRRNGRGGDYLGNVQWRALLEEKVVLRPRYQIRKAVSAIATKSPFLYRWAMQDLMFELRTSSYVNLTQWCIDPSVPFLRPPTASSEEEGEDDESDGKDDNKEDSMDVDGDANEENLDGEVGATYELPDGTHIDMSSKMGKDLCRLPELLFTDDVPYVTTDKTNNSSPAGLLSEHHTLSELPLHKLIFASLTAVGDGDVRKDLANNIILTGGSSLFPNLEQRLSLEVPRIVPSAYKCRVVASRNSIERSCSAWIGGSILTSLGSFQQLWLSKTEYEEYGTSLSTQRFP